VESFSVGSVHSVAPVGDGGPDDIDCVGSNGSGSGLSDRGALPGQAVDTADSSLEDGEEFCFVNAGSSSEVSNATLDSVHGTLVGFGLSHGHVLDHLNLAGSEVVLSNLHDSVDSGPYLCSSEGSFSSGDLIEDDLGLSSGGGCKAGDLRGSPSGDAGRCGCDADGGSSVHSVAPVGDGGPDDIGLVSLGTIALPGQAVDTGDSSLEDGGEFCKVNAGSSLEVGNATLDSVDGTLVGSRLSHGHVLDHLDLAGGEVVLSNLDYLIDSVSYFLSSEGLLLSGDLVEDDLSLCSGGSCKAGDLRGSPSGDAGTCGCDADGGSSGSNSEGEDDGVHVDRF